ASLLKSPEQIALYTARLKHLCGLIVRDRRPYCPINGLLVLIPLAAADSEESATQTSVLCQQDLATLRQVLQLHSPTFAVVCDLEKAPGFPEFLQQFPEEQRKQRLGQRFPLMPDLDPKDLPAALEEVVRSVCHNTFTNWVYKLFHTETAEHADATEVIR